MKIRDAISMSFGAIFRNKMRSFLTTLGIIIGVASVIAMVHLGQSATKSVTDQISSMGSNMLILSPGTGERGPGGRRSGAKAFDTADFEALDREIDNADIVPLVSSSQTLVWSGANYPASVIGTSPAYFEMRNVGIARGRTFDEAEYDRNDTVCLVGATVFTELFGTANPLGETLRVGRTACLVVGVLEARGASFGEDLDSSIIMPTGAVQQRLQGSDSLRQIYVSAHAASLLPAVQDSVTRLMRERRRIGRGQPDDFHLRDLQEIADTLQGTTRALTLLLGAIAAISLLVGGIGIMNIMLVSVSERTREIGVRIAIGALVSDVLLQFLVEAVALSMLGGFLGVVLGVGATWIATSQMSLPFILTPEVMIAGFGVSVLIGIVFGFVPARKAAHLNPIDALRHE